MKKGIMIAILVLFIIGGVFVTYKKMSKVENKEIAKEEVNTNPLQKYIGDMDRDGIIDEEEEKQGLSAVSFDSDKDGVSDYDEVNLWKTDPKNRDSDKDGFADGVEIIKGYNPAGPGKIKK